MAAVLNVLDLVLSDNPADYCGLPVVVEGNQSAVAIVQLQCRIGHCIWNSVLSELRANGAYDNSLCSPALDDESANHHVVAGLNKAASTEVAERCRRARRAVE